MNTIGCDGAPLICASLIATNYAKVSATFSTQVESTALINVKAVIKAAFLRLRVRNSAVAVVRQVEFKGFEVKTGL